MQRQDPIILDDRLCRQRPGSPRSTGRLRASARKVEAWGASTITMESRGTRAPNQRFGRELHVFIMLGFVFQNQEHANIRLRGELVDELVCSQNHVRTVGNGSSRQLQLTGPLALLSQLLAVLLETLHRLLVIWAKSVPVALDLVFALHEATHIQQLAPDDVQHAFSQGPKARCPTPQTGNFPCPYWQSLRLPPEGKRPLHAWAPPRCLPQLQLSWHQPQPRMRPHHRVPWRGSFAFRASRLNEILQWSPAAPALHEARASPSSAMSWMGTKSSTRLARMDQMAPLRKSSTAPRIRRTQPPLGCCRRPRATNPYCGTTELPQAKLRLGRGAASSPR